MLWFLVLLWIFFFLFFLFFKNQRPKNFPPGPWPVPLFGNIFELNLSNPLKDMERLAERYGNVYSLYLGGRPAVILTGFKAVKEALVTKGADFSGRPTDVLQSHLTQGRGVAFLDYGPAWREHRRFSLMTLRNFGMGKLSVEERILAELEHLVEDFEKSGGLLNPQTVFHSTAANVIFLFLYGIRYERTDKNLQENSDLFAKVSKAASGFWGTLYDMVPFVRSLPLPFRKAFVYMEEIKSRISGMIDKKQITRVPGEPENFVDCYLDELEKKGDKGTHFNYADLVRTIMDLQGGGTETSSNTLLTAFLYLMKHTDIQERCQQEIDEVLGSKPHASFEDRHNMPYTHALVCESQRIASILPLAVPHCTTNDTELMGYSIPKGTLVISNIDSVLKEKGQWKFPNEFNPANFLNEQGQFKKPEAFIPFSMGPRVCLGESLARMELFLIMVTLLRRFQFFWPEDAGEPDFTPVFGVTVSPKPYKMGIRLRQPARKI